MGHNLRYILQIGVLQMSDATSNFESLMMIIINLSIFYGFRCPYKYGKKFTNCSIGHTHSMTLSNSKLFQKDEK